MKILFTLVVNAIPLIALQTIVFHLNLLNKEVLKILQLLEKKIIYFSIEFLNFDLFIYFHCQSKIEFDLYHNFQLLLIKDLKQFSNLFSLLQFHLIQFSHQQSKKFVLKIIENKNLQKLLDFHF